MSKSQRLEGYMSRTLKRYNDIWWIKLQCNPMAHKTTPADYIILTKTMRYLVEAKECNDNRFEFSRLTQEADLKMFTDIHECNEAYVILMFWSGTLKKSYVYLISIDRFIEYKHRTTKKSINLAECEEYFANDRIKVEDNRLDLSRLI